MRVNGSDVLSDRNLIHVAVAVIYGEDGRLLLARRPADKHQGGLWEFPGGKVEPGECVQSALQRELQEELAIQVSELKPLISVRHDYPDKSVLLDTWIVSGISGEPRGNEGQPIQWVQPEQLRELNFPEANKSIINAVLLPDRYMVTGRFDDKHALFSLVLDKVVSGVRLVQFRAPWLAPDDYLALAKELSMSVRELGGRLIVKGEVELLNEPWCDGLHLTSTQLLSGVEPAKNRVEQWLVASCHNAEELGRSVSLGVDFVTLSPVYATATHPDAVPLGEEQAKQLTTVSPVPVYWLGGLAITDIAAVKNSGAQGVAAIRAFWGGGGK